MLEDVGSKKMVLGGSWGHVVTFWWQASASNPSWVHLGWELGGWLGAWGNGVSPGREGSLRDVPPRRWGARGGRAVKPIACFPETFKLEGFKA